MINLIGEKFGRLKVIRRLDKNRWGQYFWLCLCDCGKEKIVRGGHLTSNHTASCGCLYVIGNNYRHGYSTKGYKRRTYNIWSHIIQRSTNPKNKDYHEYGGRGITVCQRWLSFDNFLADMGEVPEKCQIDRIDNSQGYYKSNCRWATPTQQQRNRRNNKLFTFAGKTQCISAWAQEYNMPYPTLWNRLCKQGLSIEKALMMSCQIRRQ